MKRFMPIAMILVLIAIVITIFLSMSNQKNMKVIYTNNNEKNPVDITLNHFQDTLCGMTISSKENSAQVISPTGKTWFFDDVGCMVLWLEKIDFKEQAVIWVYSNDTNKYINGRTAWYSRTAKTPMSYGFGAYENKQNGFIDFNQVILYMQRGENLTDPYIKQKLLGK